ncbi:twin transmembrane helix small protein [Paracoccus sp. (in: a-proteobacteria)]|uniref:twin transmembrane helix small protein n=1 Tax=Paracoccus sp. TaxID=267 RepID=UPI0035AF642E
MHDKPLLILLAVCCLAVVVILAIGIGGFARGGEFNRKHGNRMMRWRLIAQAIAIAVFLLYLWARGS